MVYKYEKFILELDKLIEQFDDFKPQIILSVARGGQTLGHFISQRLDIRDLYSINSIYYNNNQKLSHVTIKNVPKLKKNSRVLIVDDIIDSGESMSEIIKILKKSHPTNSYKIATLFYKKDASIQPDFTLHEAQEWIDFFWEVD